jgi:hypothetical protein
MLYEYFEWMLYDIVETIKHCVLKFFSAVYNATKKVCSDSFRVCKKCKNCYEKIKKWFVREKNLMFLTIYNYFQCTNFDSTGSSQYEILKNTLHHSLNFDDVFRY